MRIRLIVSITIYIIPFITRLTSHCITSGDIINMNVSENIKTQGLNLRTTYFIIYQSIHMKPLKSAYVRVYY